MIVISSKSGSGSSGSSITSTPVSSVTIRAIVWSVLPRPGRESRNMSRRKTLFIIAMISTTHPFHQLVSHLGLRQALRSFAYQWQYSHNKIGPTYARTQVSGRKRNQVEQKRTRDSSFLIHNWVGGSSTFWGSWGCSIRIIQANPCFWLNDQDGH